MELFWNDQPNQKLKEIELAEKNWCLANERLKKSDASCDTHKDLQQEVDKLWIEYVKLKPNVSDETKKKLGCLEEIPKFNLEKLTKLTKLRPIKDLIDRVQSMVDTVTHRSEQMNISVVNYNSDDVRRVAEVLESEGFEVDVSTTRGYLKFYYKY
jgi:hypothetical protein